MIKLASPLLMARNGDQRLRFSLFILWRCENGGAQESNTEDFELHRGWTFEVKMVSYERVCRFRMNN